MSRFTVVLVALSFVGCGGNSQEDMLARAMKRTRQKDDPPAVHNSPSSIVPVTAEVEQRVQKPNQRVSDEQVVVETLSIKPIEDRQPTERLRRSERRKRSAENLKAIMSAMDAHAKKNRTYPGTHIDTPQGFKGLSWRVSLLPYLGYDDLYKKFDRRRRWDEEPNLSLLKYIPDEYVSPERFDTKTNYMVPVGTGFAFTGKQPTTVGLMEDGSSSTVFVVEVDDELATPWTQPSDWNYKDDRFNPDSIREGIGGLRVDGTFAVWGNGHPVVLANSIHSSLLLKAFTIDDGSVTLPSKIHRDISLDPGGNAALVSIEKNKIDADQLTPQPMVQESAKDEFPEGRFSIPPSVEVIEKATQLSSLYEQRIRDSKEPSQQQRFAVELLRQADQMKTDQAGMYAMKQLALQLAIESGSASVLLQAIDSIVSSFEVDAYQVNADALREFGGQSARFSQNLNSNRPVLSRLVRVISAAIGVNDFRGAAESAKLAIRVVQPPRGSNLAMTLNQLVATLQESSQTYQAVKASLNRIRQDPENDKAGTVVGRYLCFIKGDWARGLELLSKHDTTSIGQMSMRDLEGANDSSDKIRLGDAWWDLAQLTKIRVYRDGCLDRAYHWYNDVFESLPPSIDRMHVQARLSDETTSSRSPIALVERLAEQTGVDLSIPLAAVRGESGSGGLGASDDGAGELPDGV